MEIGFRLQALTIEDLKDLVHALVRLNVNAMKRERLPKLYDSGIRYRRESRKNGRGREWFLTLPQMLETGFGDCEDLAAARCAELRMKGVRAQPWFSRRGRTWHVYVRHPSGKTEDPSLVLGMKDTGE